MPKLKTHSGAKKRFKVTGSGKIKRFQSNTSHLLGHKSNKRKLRLRDAVLVDKTQEKRVKRMLSIG
ncbi:MAG: 50S ribosomal protein L35 [Saprospirales bacterium]|jgi:large subunit ribosomal protein L35|nr:MAG: 50S ribosomal protein L35 [Saprospirales bacterium]